MSVSLPEDFRALVVGASGALGAAFLRYLAQSTRCGELVGVSRSAGDFDLEIPASLEALGRSLSQRAPFHLIVDATGALTLDDVGPEKSLAKLEWAALNRSLLVNVSGPALLLRHLAPLLANGDAIYAKLSARVGSISDNQKGGWYSYRASKAAMNMVLQTASIELQRKNPRLRVVALQPGTVRSKLSQPFQAGVQQLLEPAASVEGMMKAMLALEPQSGACFIDYAGRSIPW
jgi:NAD(P)-dependent dehydrogenase (short-subunit alcohol dehydrogenase family)